MNGPAVAAQDDTVVAAWFTAPEGRPRVRTARSSDAGKTFAEAVDIDGDGAFGYVDVEMLPGGDAIVSWWRRHGDDRGRIELAIRRVGADGRLGPPQAVTTADVAQPLDMPQLEISGDSAVLAWTDPNSERVRTIRVPLP